ncbi:MAG: PqqD family peptide modification chaperone [Gemmatimonadota bacterium]
MTSNAQPRAFVLDLGQLSVGTAAGGGDWTPLSLAEALASSPLWAEMADAVLVLRPGPRPLLAVIGEFSRAEAAGVEALAGQLEHALRHLLYLTYEDVENACDRLAAELRGAVGPDVLAAARFVAIPRGGLVVLGLLSYVLDLRPSQLLANPGNTAPLVVVDDCALTGFRFRAFLRQHPRDQILFAPLCSPPELRAAILAQESRVTACVTGLDLRDHAPTLLGAEHPEWQDRWLRRSPDSYWVGQPDRVGFPWSEPDVTVWNPVTRSEQPGWRVFPPSRCVKNRYAPAKGGLQVQEAGPGPWLPRPHVLHAHLGDRVVVANLESGTAIGLDGVAADMWTALVTAGSPEKALLRLEGVYDVSEERLRADLGALMADLESRGFLEESGGARGESPGAPGELRGAPKQPRGSPEEPSG